MRSEDYMNAFANERHDKELAEFLGITYDELQSTEYHITDHIGNDDMVYGYILTFDTELSSPEILAKIADLENGDMVLLPLNYYQQPDDDYEMPNS